MLIFRTANRNDVSLKTPNFYKAAKEAKKSRSLLDHLNYNMLKCDDGLRNVAYPSFKV